MHRESVIAAMRAQRRASLRLFRALDAQDWETPCAPPWRVREVAAHLITIDEAAVGGRLLPLLRAASSRADIERWNDTAVRRWADEPVPTLLDGLQRFGARLEGRAARVPALLWRVPARTVFGRHSLGFLVARRVLDEWVHLTDVGAATGHEVGVPDGCPDVIAWAVLDALPALVLPRLELTSGVARLVVYTGQREQGGDAAPRRTWAIDFARRHYGPRVTARPDVTIRLHAADLALLVEGRTRPDAAELDITGDPVLAEAVLEGLRGSATAT